VQPAVDGGGTLVFLRLDPESRGEVAGTLDRATGLLTPAQTSWRSRPVLANRRADLMFSGHRHGVNLALERFNGWRCASVPLLDLRRTHEASQSADLLRALADELDLRALRDTQRVTPLLRAQAAHLDVGGALRVSPLAAKVGGGGAWSGLATG